MILLKTLAVLLELFIILVLVERSEWGQGISINKAMPIHTPFVPEGERFGFELDNAVLNFAIGYPF